MSSLCRSKWNKWYPKCLASLDMNCSQWNLSYTSPLMSVLPGTRTPWTHSSTQYFKALDFLKTFAEMKPAAFSTLSQQVPGPSWAPLNYSGCSHPPTELLGSYQTKVSTRQRESWDLGSWVILWFKVNTYKNQAVVNSQVLHHLTSAIIQIVTRSYIRASTLHSGEINIPKPQYLHMPSTRINKTSSVSYWKV